MSDDSVTPPSLRPVVAGTGLMARGIAAAFSAAGTDVLVLGRDLDRAEAAARDARGLQPEAAFQRATAGTVTAGVLGDTALHDVTVAVETVLEDMAVKQDVLALLDRDLPADAVIGTNTASFSLEALAEQLSVPGRFAGWHFMNPAHLTGLAEVIPGPQTEPDTIERLIAATRALGKTPIQMNFELPGFVWNRLIFAMWRECEHIVQSGAADRASVDAAVSDGLAARWTAGGPFVTMDLGGLDDFARAAEQILPQLANDTSVPARLWEAAAAGESLYSWSPEQRKATEQLRRQALESGAVLAHIRRGIGLA
ncbi:MAG: 3-hydroxyacyl-CoA dehydrogenase family protein [Nocardioidaceae bacterium]